MRRRTLLGSGSSALLAPAIVRAAAGGEIKIGNTMPYSGPLSAYGAYGRAEAAYFRMVNDRGGINGRTIDFISLDDAGSPPKTVEQVRLLVEQDGVVLLFSNQGTASNTAVVKYVNRKKIPHLFLAAGGDQWGDYKEHPWTIGWRPSFRVEAQIYAKYIQRVKPGARIGILYQNDDMGKDYVAGIGDVIGEAAMKTVPIASYELADPTVESQIVTLKAAGVDVLVSAATARFATMVIRKVSDLAWAPLHIMSTTSVSAGSVMIPAGAERGIGIVSSAFMKDPTDPAWDHDPGMDEWRAFMAKYMPDGDLKDIVNVLGYGMAFTLAHVLTACGGDLSRENILRQATGMDHLANPILLPGITLNTSPTNYHPLRQSQLIRWNGRSWERFGEIIEGGGA